MESANTVEADVTNTVTAIRMVVDRYRGFDFKVCGVKLARIVSCPRAEHCEPTSGGRVNLSRLWALGTISGAYCAGRGVFRLSAHFFASARASELSIVAKVTASFPCLLQSH
jgi:hypothetical protein